MESSLPHNDVTGVVLEEHLSTRAAAVLFGAYQQYPRHLLRTGRLEGVCLITLEPSFGYSRRSLGWQAWQHHQCLFRWRWTPEHGA